MIKDRDSKNEPSMLSRKNSMFAELTRIRPEPTLAQYLTPASLNSQLPAVMETETINGRECEMRWTDP